MRDVWNPYAASHRLINLLSWMALRRRPDAALNAHARLCAALVLADLERDLGFNHLLKNFVALAMYGIPLDPRQVARIVGDCVLADGGHAERSPMYHVLGLLDLRVLRELGYDVADATLRMERALSVMSHPDGDIALFNDSWIGGAPRAADVAPIFHDMRDLPDTGYVKLASGGDAVIFDCGAAGPDRNPAHAHADFLSIELSVGGKRVIVDPGVATYTAGPERQECRSAAAHNGPVVVGTRAAGAVGLVPRRAARSRRDRSTIRPLAASRRCGAPARCPRRKSRAGSGCFPARGCWSAMWASAADSCSPPTCQHRRSSARSTARRGAAGAATASRSRRPPSRSRPMPVAPRPGSAGVRATHRSPRRWCGFSMP